MALTLVKSQRLRDRGFDAFFKEHREIFKTMLDNAKRFLDETFADHEIIRQEDLAKAIADHVETEPNFKKYVDQNKYREQHWAKDFADYVVEQIANPEYTKRAQKGHKK